jgi:hypothetical protein
MCEDTSESDAMAVDLFSRSPGLHQSFIRIYIYTTTIKQCFHLMLHSRSVVLEKPLPPNVVGYSNGKALRACHIFPREGRPQSV